MKHSDDEWEERGRRLKARRKAYKARRREYRQERTSEATLPVRAFFGIMFRGKKPEDYPYE